MNYKVISLVAAGLLMVGCASKKDGTQMGGGDASSVGVTAGTYEDFKVNVGDRVFFDLDKSALTSEGKAVLDRQAEWLGRYAEAKIVIEGHCDERGTHEYNLALGERRAKAVKDYLLSKGVNTSRIHSVSYGKERLEFQGNSEDVHAKNRRGVTVVQ